MVINIGNFFSSNNKNTSIGDFQDLEHIDGVAISSLSANLYNEKRDDDSTREKFSISLVFLSSVFWIFSFFENNLKMIFFIKLKNQKILKFMLIKNNVRIIMISR